MANEQRRGGRRSDALAAIVVLVLFAIAIWLARTFAPEDSRGTLLIALVALALVTASVLAATHLGQHEHISTGAHIVQSVVTAAAIGLAGYFYFLEGRGKPHADVSQTVQAAPLPDGNVVVEASVVVKNLGTQPLRITKLVSVLQAVDLRPLSLESIAGDKKPYWNTIETVGGQSAHAFQEAELQWPQMRRFDDRINHQIEAGESDLITVTFLVPCVGVRYLRVATDVTKSGREQMAWKARTFVDLDPACKGERANA
jgi:hypothetical protein